MEATELEALPVKPIAITINTRDIQMLYAMKTSPDTYHQLLLAKLRDAGGPVEGSIRYRLAHGQLFKLKTNPLKEQDAFEYVWLPEEYVAAMSEGAPQA